jgi:hypothetical protein
MNLQQKYYPIHQHDNFTLVRFHVTNEFTSSTKPIKNQIMYL